MEGADRLRGQALPWGLGLAGVVLGLAVARAPLTLLVGGLGALAIVVGSLYEPLIGMGAALVIGPFRAWLEIRSPGLAPHVGQALLVVAVGAWAVRILLDGRAPRSSSVTGVRPLGPPASGGDWLMGKSHKSSLLVWLAPLAVFLGVGLLSLWDPVDVWAGFTEWVKWAQVLLVAVIVYDRLARTGARGVALALGGLGASAVLQALVGLWQFGLGGTQVEAFAIDARFYRAFGTFQQPNPFAGFMGLIGALAAGLAAATLVDRWRAAGEEGRSLGGRIGATLLGSAWAVVPAMLIAAGVGASWSRGGWMGFGVAVLVMVIFVLRHSAWGAILVGAAVALIAGAMALGRLPASVVERLTGFLSYVQFEDVRGAGITDATYAVLERMAHWQAALGMWRSRFWLGIGLGGYEAAYATYRLIAWPMALGHAHNVYLNLLAEVGLLGLGAYLFWLGSLVLGAIRVLRRAVGWPRALALGLLGAWTHLAVHSLVDYLLVNNVHLHVGVLVALSGYVVARSRGADHHSQTATS